MSLAVYNEPTSLVQVDGQCAAIEAWADTCESVPELRDAGNKLAAIDEYLNRTSTEGRSRVAAAMRRLEVRIGALLGPAEHGGDRKSDQARRDGLDPVSRHQRQEFRDMAEHPEVVEEVIAEATDEAPASRRKVMERIRNAKANNPVEPPNPKSRAGIEARVAKAKEMAAAGASSRQIGEAIGLGVEGMRVFRQQHGIEVPADDLVAKTRRIDSNRVVAATVSGASDLCVGLTELIDFEALDPDLIEGWVSSLSDSIRSLTTLRNHLKKELTHE